jgi:hypothetical protein
MNRLTHNDLKEQKKMRKQRRQAELQDKRDRIRMGLIPPDPPKGLLFICVGHSFAHDPS